MIEKINQILKNQVAIAKRLDKIEGTLLDLEDLKLQQLETVKCYDPAETLDSGPLIKYSPSWKLTKEPKERTAEVPAKHHARIESLVKSMVLFPNSTSKYLDELRVELDIDLPKEQLPWEGEDR